MIVALVVVSPIPLAGRAFLIRTVLACLLACETTIGQHIQHLSNAIAQEKVERQQSFAEVQTQINDLRAAFDAFTIAPVQRFPAGRSDEIVTARF